MYRSVGHYYFFRGVVTQLEELVAVQSLCCCSGWSWRLRAVGSTAPDPPMHPKRTRGGGSRLAGAIASERTGRSPAAWYRLLA